MPFRFVDYCMSSRIEWDIFPAPENLVMPRFMQNNINSHIDQSITDGLDIDATIRDVERFRMSEEDIQSPQLKNTIEDCNTVELNGRLTFEEMKNKESTTHVDDLPLGGRHSVNLGIEVPPHVLDPVLQSISTDLIPTKDDTKESLIKRIDNCTYLDPINSLYPAAPKKSRRKFINKGTFKQGLTRQNGSVGWRQPKRRSESVVVKPEHIYDGSDGEGQGREVMSLYNYTSYGRYPDDWRGRPMNMATFNFMLYIWKECWPYLTNVSRAHPPTHCQLLFYYVMLGSQINRHRDNFDCKDIKKVLKGKCGDAGVNGHPSAGADNSQIVGSNVLVYSEGPTPMTFTLKCAPRDDLSINRKEYTALPSFQFTCGKGTISILDPVDDFMMTHEASFANDEDMAGYRWGFSIRWLASEKDFYTDTCGFRLDKQALASKSHIPNFPRADEVFPEFVRHIRT